MIASDKSHSSFVTIAKKVSESIVISSYEQNKKQSKKGLFRGRYFVWISACVWCIYFTHVYTSGLMPHIFCFGTRVSYVCAV